MSSLVPSETPASLDQVMALLRARRELWHNVTHVEHLPAREARFAPWPERLHPELRDVLLQRGIARLFTHQAAAVESILDGRHTVVVTPTASGKSLCYAVPLLHALLGEPEARALCLFPTKALSHDQLDTLLGHARALGRDIRIFSYDGDTPGSARRAIRQAGHVVVTNPDMLHSAILPNHTLWRRLFENLRYIVIDEVHSYRGVFGSNFANVVRRLRRLAAFYGARPTFIALSATIANPRELCEELVGEPFALVDDNGAPQAEKAFVFYNPPVVNRELGIRRSVVKEAQRVAMRFIGAGMQTIVFARTRARVEILTTYLKREMERLGRDPRVIRGYRGGYLPTERRAIEQGIRSGDVLGVVSTNALEMGIDIGALRVAVLAGYPGSIASTWQQGGRAGRKDAPSLVVLVGSSEPVDQFILNNPAYFFGASPELGIINADNVSILASHVKCAAFELPFGTAESFGGTDVQPVLEFLEKQRIVLRAGDRFRWTDEAYPAEHVSLRRADPENFIVQNAAERNVVIAEVDYHGAPFLIHENAIYIHDGKTFHVDSLDWEKRIALVRPIETDYYTDAVAKTEVRVLEVEREAALGGPRGAGSGPGGAWPFEAKRLGEVTVQTVVAKFKKVKFETHESIGYGDVHVPLMEMQTEAYWLTLAADLAEGMKAEGRDANAALGGLAHALANVIPAIAMCDARDISCLAMMKAPHDERPSIYIYDRFPGGVGLARRLFSRDVHTFQAALDLVTHCPCDGGGCPSCVGPPLDVGPAGRSTVRWLLERLIGALR